jgi:hypothetical protein
VVAQILADDVAACIISAGGAGLGLRLCKASLTPSNSTLVSGGPHLSHHHETSPNTRVRRYRYSRRRHLGLSLTWVVNAWIFSFTYVFVLFKNKPIFFHIGKKLQTLKSEMGMERKSKNLKLKTKTKTCLSKQSLRSLVYLFYIKTIIYFLKIK